MDRLGSKCTICATPCQESSEETLSRFANKRLMRIFCEYFNLSSSQYESTMEGFYFCTTCRAQVHRLCFLNKRLQETQSEIAKIVAKFTLTIIETESSQENNLKCTKQTTNKSLIKIEQFKNTPRYGELVDEYILEFSQEIQDARSFICKSYQPQVVLTQCEDIPNVSRMKRKCVKPISLHSLLSDNEWDPIDDNFWDASPNSSAHFEDQFINITSTSLSQEIVEKNQNDSVLSTPKSNIVKKIRKKRCEDNQVDKKIIPRRRKKLPSSPSIFKRIRRRNRVSTAPPKVKIRVQKLIRQSEYSFRYGSWSLEQDPITKYFKCLTCGKSRKSRGDIIRHINCKHNSERATCEVCGKSWENPKRLGDHNCRPKSEDKRRKCTELPQGQFVYMKRWFFEKVNKDDEKDTQYKCHTCGSLKPSLPQMYAHLSHRHENPNKYICELCGKHYAIKASFVAHQTLHKEARDIICEICGKNFRTKNVLAAHMQGHQDRRWTCEICGRSFKYSKGLGKHRRDVNHFKGSQPSLQQLQPQHPPPNITQEESHRDLGEKKMDFVERRPETTSSIELETTSALPTDYSLSHLIFQERLQAEFSQSLRNLQF